MTTATDFPGKGSQPNTEAEQLIRDRVGQFFDQRHFRTRVAQGTEHGVDVECWQLDASVPSVPERWRIEAKGWKQDDANRPGGFLSGVAQTLQLMDDPMQFAGTAIYYALAMPNTSHYQKYCRNISSWVRKQLGLHWIWVPKDPAPSGTLMTITIQCPLGCRCGFQKSNDAVGISHHQFSLL